MHEHDYPRSVPTPDPWPNASLSGAYKVVPVDALVIKKDDLPHVSPGRWLVSGPVGGVLPDADPEDLVRRALGYLAIAEYLRANPPVDEGQVAEVTKALYAATSDPYDIDVPDVARRLVQAGVRVGNRGPHEG